MAQRIFATLALLVTLSTAHATRVLEQPERPFELTLAQLTLPSSTTGGIAVKPCDECAYSTHVMTATTQFFVNGQLLPYAEFHRIADQVRANRQASQTAMAGVFVDVETGRVTRVTLRHRGL
jgi:hypothetical protein